MKETFYNLRETGRLLGGFNARTVRRMIDRGRIPEAQLWGQKTWRIPESAIQRLKEEARTRAFERV